MMCNGDMTRPNAADLAAGVEELQEWLQVQTLLPTTIPPTLLKRFLHTMCGDLAAAKQLLEFNFTLRNKHPQIFIERDPMDGSSQQLLQVADLVPLPGLTPEHNKLLIYRLVDYDADKFNFTAGIKVFFMVADCRFALEGTDERLSEGEIPIFDMAGYTLRHLTKTVLSSLRIYMKFVQEAHPVRLKAVHVLNCPAYLDKVITVVKPFIKSEVFKLIHFHLPNADTPYAHIPRDMMPDEYGGKAGKMAELKRSWLELLQTQRNYLSDAQQWRTHKNRKGAKAKSDCLADANLPISSAPPVPPVSSVPPAVAASVPVLMQSLRTLEID